MRGCAIHRFTGTDTHTHAHAYARARTHAHLLQETFAFDPARVAALVRVGATGGHALQLEGEESLGVPQPSHGLALSQLRCGDSAESAAGVRTAHGDPEGRLGLASNGPRRLVPPLPAKNTSTEKVRARFGPSGIGPCCQTCAKLSRGVQAKIVAAWFPRRTPCGCVNLGSPPRPQAPAWTDPKNAPKTMRAAARVARRSLRGPGPGLGDVSRPPAPTTAAPPHSSWPRFEDFSNSVGSAPVPLPSPGHDFRLL